MASKAARKTCPGSGDNQDVVHAGQRGPLPCTPRPRSAAVVEEQLVVAEAISATPSRTTSTMLASSFKAGMTKEMVGLMVKKRVTRYSNPPTTNLDTPSQ